MKQRIIKLYRAAKRIVPVLTIILLLGQIPAAYIDLAHQVKGDHNRMHTRTK